MVKKWSYWPNSASWLSASGRMINRWLNDDVGLCRWRHVFPFKWNLLLTEVSIPFLFRQVREWRNNGTNNRCWIQSWFYHQGFSCKHHFLLSSSGTRSSFCRHHTAPPHYKIPWDTPVKKQKNKSIFIACLGDILSGPGDGEQSHQSWVADGEVRASESGSFREAYCPRPRLCLKRVPQSTAETTVWTSVKRRRQPFKPRLSFVVKCRSLHSPWLFCMQGSTGFRSRSTE